MLKREPFDIGFNPWSHGQESEYFISFAKRFHAYGAFADFPLDAQSLRPRACLSRVATKTRGAYRKNPVQPKRILISPFSTDVRKSLNADDLKKLVAWLGKRYENASLALALFPEEDAKVGDLPLARFYFGKSRKRSRAFLELVKGSDLFVGVDAGPLHLADALGIPSIGIFGPTAPETILDRDSGIVPLRLNAMQGWFCDIRDCADPCACTGCSPAPCCRRRRWTSRIPLRSKSRSAEQSSDQALRRAARIARGKQASAFLAGIRVLDRIAQSLKDLSQRLAAVMVIHQDAVRV